MLQSHTDNVNIGVHLAVRMRISRMPMKLRRFNEQVTQKKLNEIPHQFDSRLKNFLVIHDSSKINHKVLSDDDDQSLTDNKTQPLPPFKLHPPTDSANTE